MPIFDFYCPDNHRIYSFYARTRAQAEIIPPCPDNPDYRMVKMMSSFAIHAASKTKREESAGNGEGGDEAMDDPRMEAAFAQMEREMEGIDENDPRAMGRLMRRMAELTGEKLDPGMEEMVRQLEAGRDPEELEEEMGDLLGEEGEEASTAEDAAGETGKSVTMDAQRLRLRRQLPPRRDPQLYDYPS